MIALKNWPTQSHRISSPFGYRIHPITGKRTMHNGIDIGGLQVSGESIVSVADGRVTASYYNQSRGWVVLIDHGGWQSLYQHLTKQGASVNTLVKAEQIVGQMGNTGASAGVHLHFEMRLGGQCVDPVPYLKTIVPVRPAESEDEDMVKYKKIKDVPEWGRIAIQTVIDKGGLVPDDQGNIDLTESMLRIYVGFYRMGKI